MYPKSTFSKREIIKSDNVNNSHLFLHNGANAAYQSFDIDMDYLLLYEAVNLRNERFTYQEFTENTKILIESSYEFMMKQSRKLHFHKFYELTFVLSGTLTMQIEDESLTFQQGDCCLCNKNIHHLELMDQDTEIVLFLLKEEFIQNICQNNYYYDHNDRPHPIGTVFDMFFSENGKDVLTDAKIYASYKCTEKIHYDSVISIINQMIIEITSSHSGKSYMMKALFCRFFEMLENDELYTQSIHWAKLSHEEEIIEQILRAYKTKDGIFSRKEIEEITGYHSDHIERIVKKQTGKTLSELVRDLLLKKATYLLSKTELSITDICQTLGYSNRNYFNKVFQKQYGMLPSEYRKQDE